MKAFKNTIGVLFLVFIFIQTSAQDFNGIAIYKTSSKIQMTMDSTKVSINDQKNLNDLIRKSMQKEYELRFNKTTSLYQLIESLNINDGSQGIEVIGLGSGTEGGLYKNIKNLSLVENRDVFGKLFLIKDDLVSYDWILQSEIRQIGQYICHKAISIIKSVKKIKTIDKNGVEIEENRESTKTITAWYTPQIPVNTGPASYWGLPGLIMEVDDGRLIMICAKITLNPKEKIAIKQPTKGKLVDNEQFKIIYMDKIKEMQEVYTEKRKKEKKNH